MTLTVTDNDGKTGSTSKTVQVGPNQAPTAAFAQQCFGFVHLCTFDGRGSSDPDGMIASWAWNFGDGTTGSGEQVTHNYGRAGTFTVTLTVTDDRGASNTTRKNITVP